MLTIYAKSISIRPSVLGYISRFVALVNSGKSDEGYQACDIAFEHFPSHVTIFLLIKVCVLCSRTGSFGSLIGLGCCPVHGREAARGDVTRRRPYRCRVLQLYTLRRTGMFMRCYHVVSSPLIFQQAYMYLLVGKSQMESRYYNGAIQSLEDARTKLGDRAIQPHWVVLLVYSLL